MKRITKSYLFLLAVTCFCCYVYLSNANDSSVANAPYKFGFDGTRGNRILEDENDVDDGGDGGDDNVADDGENGGDDDVADDGGERGDDNVADDGGDGGDDNVADDGENGGDDDVNSYIDDEYTFNNRVKQKVIVYKDIAEEKFWEIYNNPPKDWTADQWGFFSALMTLLSFAICCCCAVCFIPCYSRNKNEKEESLLSKELPKPSLTPRKRRSTPEPDESHDPIMYARSYDSQVV